MTPITYIIRYPGNTFHLKEGENELIMKNDDSFIIRERRDSVYLTSINPKKDLLRYINMYLGMVNFKEQERTNNIESDWKEANVFLSAYLITTSNEDNFLRTSASLIRSLGSDIKIRGLINQPHSFIIENTNLNVSALNISTAIIDVPYLIDPYVIVDNEYQPAHDFTSIRDLYPDIDILIGDKTFKTHKAILMAMSDYFFNILSKVDTVELQMEEQNPQDEYNFEKILNLIYGSKMGINGLETMELLALIQAYGIKGFNVDEIIKLVLINKEKESNKYIELLSYIYPLGYSKTLSAFVSQNITPETDVSRLNYMNKIYLGRVFS